MKAKRRFIRAVLLLLTALAALAALVYDSNTRLTVTEYTLSYENLPSGFDGFRITQLSDVHLSEYSQSVEALAEATAGTEPDIIALTGDLIDANSDMDEVTRLLHELTDIAPVYYVTGNHEFACGMLDDLRAALADTGAVYLQNDCVLLTSGGDSVVLAGVEDPNGRADMIKPDELAADIAAEQPDTFIILLGHRNYWLEQYPELPVDLIFCGHAHGGIIRLPFVGALLGTGGELFPDDTDSVIGGESYDMIVSHGIGAWQPVPRLLNNPEIVAVTLKSEK
ncbi:MAG: metallophosphoesterase [Oscillospiraceae bacterium]|nr:metallophosphoesterase [Oscillospiraceae bacterium]